MKFTFWMMLCFYSCLVFADNYHNQLIISGIDVESPFWEFASQKISQKEPGSFAQLITKWNQKINIVWNNLRSKIKEEINVTPEQIDYYLDDQRFIDAYLNYYRKIYAEFIDETQDHQNEDDDDEIDPIILNFIMSKLEYLQLCKPAKVRIKRTLPFFITTFGTDKKGHYLIINDLFYNAEKINTIYESTIQGTTKFYIQPGTHLHGSCIIEYNNLFHLIITQCLSSIIHQHDYFAKMLTIFIVNNKILSEKTQIYGIGYTIFLSYLEACLQSKNPVEAAIFIEPSIGNLNQEYVLLWREFIQDLENCYDEQDLAAYKDRALLERRAVLFQKDIDQDNN